VANINIERSLENLIWRAKLRRDLRSIFLGKLKGDFLLSNLASLGNKDCPSPDFSIYKVRSIAKGCGGGLRQS